MRWTVARWVSGFVIGCALFVWSFILAGVGHGSIVPLASAAPFVFAYPQAFDQQGFAGLLSLVVMWLGTGSLWAIYFGALPTIHSIVIRVLLVLFVVGIHVGT